MLDRLDMIASMQPEKWAGTSLKKRMEKIALLRRRIADQSQVIAQAISDECERPLAETYAQEILPVLEMCRYLLRAYPAWLREVPRLYLRPGFIRKKNYSLREPIGTFAVITPYNFPFSLAMMTLVYLLLPGNAVVLKPSERSKRVAPLIYQMLNEAGLCPSVSLVVTGGPETGKQLIENPLVKKVVFFGGRAAGGAVAKQCIEFHKPHVLELGGGTTALVFDDADLHTAASGIAWSGLYSNGKSCIATDRVLVDEAIADKFLPELVARVSQNVQERPPRIEAGDAERLEHVIRDAEERGANIIRCAAPESRFTTNTPGTVICNIGSSMRISHEEIFGPILAVGRFSHISDAIEAVSRGYQPLGISLWTRNRKRAFQTARAVDAGMIWINDTSFGLPILSWMGRNTAGCGGLFSQASLHEITREKWISYHPSRFAGRRFWWNPYTPLKEKLLAAVARFL